jgi:hypothetical protein
MSSPSPPKEMGEQKPCESLPRPSGWSRSVSIDELNSDHESAILPPPVVAVSAACNRPKKTIRIDAGRGIRNHWARFRRRLGAGTSPSTSSLVDGSTPGSNVGIRGDAQGESQCGDDTEVDEVVVDRDWADEIKSSVSLSEQNTSLDRPGGHYPVAGPSTDRDSVALHTGGFWGLCAPLTILRWRLFPPIVDFFATKFHDQKSELHYVKENWFMRKVRRVSQVVFTFILIPKPFCAVAPSSITIAAARDVVFPIPYRKLGCKYGAHSTACCIIRQNICLWGT